MKEMTRRQMMQMMAASVPAIPLAQAFGQPGGPARNATAPATEAARPLPPAPTRIIPPAGFGEIKGPFQATWESLSTREIPEWYRDVKFGIWAHWGPQCQPEQGDWYAMNMYNPNHAHYRFHVQHYGHPSKFGFKDVCNEWKAEKWDPVALIALYKKAGAKFFAQMINHHDGFDMFDSTYQPWNSVKVGPKKDLLGGWAKAAREAGLRLAVSSHGGRTYSWMGVSRNSDPSGPMAGVPYDGVMSKADGKGFWWEGLDPQDLYAQYMPRPARGGRGRGGFAFGGWAPDKAYADKFFYRIVDCINKYDPDILYFDDAVMPLYPSTDVGLRIMAYLYNKSIERHGRMEAVMTGKNLRAEQRKAITLDLERAVSGAADPIPWQTDTCIGEWHYKRSIFDQHRYKTAMQVVQMLIDIVSKNGNLMLSIPLPGNGMPDDDEMKVLDGLAKWIPSNGEAIYGTRPWVVHGEGPSTTAPQRRGMGTDVRVYTSDDYRFTKKGDVVYAFAMSWPENGKATIKSLAQGSENFPREIAKVELLGAGPVTFSRDASGLMVNMPDKKPNDYAYALKVTPR
jgi:alpha-L-fucosidase